MGSRTAFRVSTYLTLGVACTALGHAVYPIFPEAGAFAALSVLALAIIYSLEVRVRLLSIADANRLGGGLAIGLALWAAYRIVLELRTGRSAELGWTLFGVALMAPLLMAAIPAKMLRREKHAGDYWQLHAAGLGAIVLATAVDESPLSVLAMAVYIACAVWNLAEFYLARADGTIPPIPLRAAGPDGSLPGEARRPPVRVVAGRAQLPGIVRALLLSAAAVLVALPLYLIMPRSSFSNQDFGKPRIEVGYAADQMVDLNRTGKLDTNREVAFEVEARQNGQPKTDLSPNRRWRGAALVQYRSGTWQKDVQVRFPTPRQTARHPLTRWSPPNLGTGRFELHFSVPADLGEFLADPVVWRAGDSVPIADVLPTGVLQPWFDFGGVFSSQPGIRHEEPMREYVQYYRSEEEPDLGPGIKRDDRVDRIDREFLDCPPAAVRDYGDRVLARLVAMKRLPAAVLDRSAVNLTVRPEHHEAVARAFSHYLSHDANLTYTTDLRRGNREIDAVEEFLLHTRKGHCERFASALVLLLRSQGIPAYAVLGFVGCEHQGQGKYVVRQEHAHVWAEALISRPAPEGERLWHWLSLDPSPTEEADDTESRQLGGVLGKASAWGRATLDRYIIRYSPDERKRAIAAASRYLTDPRLLGTAGILIGIALIGFAARRYRNRPRPPVISHETAWLDRLVGLLAAAGFHPAPGQTPREFATEVARELERAPRSQSVASVPIEWVDNYYATRYGGDPPSEVVQLRLELRLEELRYALTVKGPFDTSPPAKGESRDG